MRPSWGEYFHELARIVATRATCKRKKVGVVIVRDRQILATGYNGSLPGHPHCTDVGCLMIDNHCARTIHAEANAVAQAAKRGVSLAGADAFTTIKPCWNCAKLLTAAGVVNMYWAFDYGAEWPAEALPKAESAPSELATSEPTSEPTP